MVVVLEVGVECVVIWEISKALYIRRTAAGGIHMPKLKIVIGKLIAARKVICTSDLHRPLCTFLLIPFECGELVPMSLDPSRSTGSKIVVISTRSCHDRDRTERNKP